MWVSRALDFVLMSVLLALLPPVGGSDCPALGPRWQRWAECSVPWASAAVNPTFLLRNTAENRPWALCPEEGPWF